MDNAAVLIDVLNCFFWGRPLTEECFDNVMSDPGGFIQFAQIHSVQGIAAYKLCEYALQFVEDEEYSSIAEVTAGYYTKVYKECGQREAAFREVKWLLNENKIDFIPFKGIVVKDCYDVPWLRSYGDIDIVIHEHDRKKCHELMLKNGYKYNICSGTVYSYEKSPEHYEMHTEIMTVNVTKNADCKGYFKKLWAHARIYKDREYRFTPEFHLIYMITHIAKHIYYRGAGIRMYLDIAFIIKNKSEKIDWNYVLTELKKLRLDKFFAVVLGAIKRWFNTEPPIDIEEADKKTMDEFCKFTMDGGVYGDSGISYARAKIRISETEGKKAIKLRAVINAIFPPFEEMASRYAYVKDNPWLLPVSWIQRAAANLSKIKQKIKETGEVLSSDEDVSRLNEFYADIGL